MANPRIPYRMAHEQPRLPPMQGKRILVIDDDATARRTLERAPRADALVKLTLKP